MGDGGGYVIFDLISPIKISFLHVKQANALALIMVSAIYFHILPLYIDFSSVLGSNILHVIWIR